MISHQYFFGSVHPFLYELIDHQTECIYLFFILISLLTVPTLLFYRFNE